MKKIFLFTTTILFFNLLITSCEKEPLNSEKLCVVHIKDDITENTIWKSTCAYYIDQSINVTNNATLTIEPGAQIKFGQDVKLDVSYYSDSPGNIVAIGTKEKPIIFTAQATVKTKGDWDGLWLYKGANASKFAYCVFEYAGGYGSGGGEGAITINHAKSVAIDYCTFKNNNSYGVLISQSPSALSSFSFNQFENNTTNDLKLSAYNVEGIEEGNVFSKNIDVVGDQIDKPGEVVWRKQNASYVIKGRTEVGSASGTTLIIEAGTSIKLAKSSLEIGYYATDFGRIKAIGTSTEPIEFTSASDNPSRGDWGGVNFGYGSSAGSVFEYCNFSYGGSNDFAMILFLYEQGSKTSISNSSFSNSAGYGIMLNQPNSDSSYPTLSNNSFSNNSLGNRNW